MKLYVVLAFFQLINSIAGFLDLTTKYYFQDPKNLSFVEKDNFECPTPKRMTRVCNLFTKQPCICGSTFTPNILKLHSIGDNWICSLRPFPETLAFRISINDVPMTYVNFEIKLLTIFATSRFDRIEVERNLTKIAETVKITTARCGFSNPYTEIIVALPGSYSNVSTPFSTYHALKDLKYDMSKILRNKLLYVVKVRLLKQSAKPSIFESLRFQNKSNFYFNTKHSSAQKVDNVLLINTPDTYNLGCWIIGLGIGTLVILLLSCFNEVLKLRQNNVVFYVH